MSKNSTPTSTTAEAAAPRLAPRPRRATLDRIRQFARAYTYTPVAGTLGGIVLN